MANVNIVHRSTLEESGDDGLALKDRIRQLRLAAGLSQEALAKAIGITQPSLSLIERGATLSLHGDTLMRMAQVFGEDPEYIRTGRRPAKRDDGSPEAAAVAIFRQMGPTNQVVWLEIGKTLVSRLSGSAQPLHNVQRAGQVVEGQRDQIAQGILDQLKGILDTHGPDAFARALGSIQGATSKPPEPHPTPRKTKHRT